MKRFLVRVERLFVLGLGVGMLAMAGCDQALIPNELNEGALTADFTSGRQYTASSASAKLQGDDILIASQQDVSGLPPDEIYLVIPAQSGSSFTVTPATNANTQVEYCETVGTSCNQYYGRLDQGDVTITVTSVTRDASGNPISLEGSFQGTLIKRGVEDSVRTISSGQFNVSVQ